jgi:hypothetical protein
MIECLSLQHAHLLYKEGKLNRQFLEALCVGYTGDNADVEYSEEDLTKIVAEYCKVEHLFMRYGGGNLFIAENTEDLKSFAESFLRYNQESVAEMLDSTDYLLVSKDRKSVYAFYATNNSGGPLVCTSLEIWVAVTGKEPEC